MKVFALLLASLSELVLVGLCAQTILSSQDRIATIEAFLALDNDPVEVTRLLHTGDASDFELDEPRLIQIMGRREKEWLTEGDKLRLRKDRIGFIDLTDFQDLEGSASAIMDVSPTGDGELFETDYRDTIS